MDKKLRKWSIIGVFVTFVLANGWHFLFDLIPCGITAALAPVNESPWEHAKLFFMPAVLWYTAQYFIIGRRYPNFIFAHSIALPVMPALMLALYSLYEPLIGESLVANLINSFFAVAAGAWLAYRLTVSKKDFSGERYRAIALFIILALLAVFAVFTYAPPHCALFYDVSAGHYGISG